MKKLVTMTRNEVVNFYATLGNVKHSSQGAKLDFSFAINLNKRRLNPIASSVQETIGEYEKKRQELLAKHTKIDEDGNQVIENGVHVFEDPEAFATDLEELIGETSIDKFMEEKVECEIITISTDKAPDLPITMVENLLPLFDEYHEYEQCEEPTS